MILHAAAELRGLVAAARTRADVEEAHELVLRLDRLLAQHLVREDAEVYPTLQACADPDVRAMARDAVEDMGGLHQAWAAFVAASHPDEAMRDLPRFRTACAAVLGALAERILFEDERLYPLAERLGALSTPERAA